MEEENEKKMRRRTPNVMALLALFLISTVVMGNFVAGHEIQPDPDLIDITIERASFFVKGYMKHGFIFVIDTEYRGIIYVKATFTHFRSGHVFTFDFEDTFDGLVYIFPAIKKMPSGLYHIIIHITSVI